VVAVRVEKRRLMIPAAVALGLFVPAVPTATATTTPADPTPQLITGQVQTVIREEAPDRRGSGVNPTTNDTRKVLRVGNKVVPLDKGSLTKTRDGATVTLSVVPGRAGEKRVLSVKTISTKALATPLVTAIPSTHQVYVAVVLPVGLTADRSITDASVRAMVTRVSQYWSSQTATKVSFNTAQVLPVYRSAYGCSSTSSMWNEAFTKMPGASGPGKHLVVVAPNGAGSSGCAYGLGTVGAVEATRNLVFVSGLNQSLLAHELGHNLGLYHSNALRCSGAQDLPRVGLTFPGCQSKPYDDLFDVMGYSGTNYGEGNLNAVHLDGMNLLPGAVRRLPANSGVTITRLAPLSALLSTATTNRTLKITDSTGERYFVQYRTNSGRDAAAGLTYWRPSWGVRVLRDDPSAPASAGSYELDATPTSLSTNEYNRSVPVGGTFTSASKKLTIRVSAQDASGATITVTNWSAPIVPARATLSIPTTARIGVAITAATRVSDVHGRMVANWGVTLQKLPRGTTSWLPVKYLRTTSAGAASYRFVNGASGQYRWVTSGITGAPTRISPIVSVTSTP